jgi:O-antigen/teichoic acid export membrane protein
VASRSPHRLDRGDVPYGETPLVVANGPSLPATEMPTDFLRSIFANWTGEAVIVVSGFILPRLMSQGMGQEQLGIWDYGWSMRAYVALSGSALSSGAGHYVARYRASEQWPELARTLGAMLALVIYASACSALLTGGLAYFTPRLINTTSVADIGDARSLVLSMGAASCLSMVVLVFGGIIAGCGRFDALNLVDGLSDVLMVVSLVTCVLFGFGLKTMGTCVLMREVLNAVAKYLCARRILPQLRVRPRWTDRSTFRDISRFGAKTIVDTLSKLLQYQVASLVIAAFIGPAALALYSRPRALILITTRFVMGFARVLVPAASAFHGQRDRAGLGELLVRSTRYAMFLALPPALVLLILGRAIMAVWMGDSAYTNNNVLLILVLGYLPLFAQQATYHILLGLASHGLAGVASLIGSSVGAGLSILFVWVLGWGIEGAALATAIPVFAVNFFVLPYAGCRATGVPLLRYLRESVVPPLLSAVPFAVVLLAARIWLPDDPRDQLLVGLVAGTSVMAVVYWPIVPIQFKQRIFRWRSFLP